MKLEDALLTGQELVLKLSPHCGRIALAGSIRRQRPECNDIDIVAEVTDHGKFISTVLHLLPDLSLKGPKIYRGVFNGKEVDIYTASERTYDTLLLIRTGSKEHNIRLTKAAIRKNWKLKADGTGLIDGYGNILATTERDIFGKLGLEYLPPEQRELEVVQ